MVRRQRIGCLHFGGGHRDGVVFGVVLRGVSRCAGLNVSQGVTHGSTNKNNQAQQNTSKIQSQLHLEPYTRVLQLSHCPVLHVHA